jgi:hydroxymethylpyrimidine/phosphomethylpyrimidine kinase
VPRCLTAAASDSGGGAGVQADLKAFAAAGCHGTCAIAALTAQNTLEVKDIFEIPPAFITAQLEAVFADIGCDAAKTGALISAAAISTVASFFAAHPVPLVVDPVMVASSGGRLLADDALPTLVVELLPLATVVTPNVHEAAILAEGDGDRRTLAERIVERGARAVVITGGHADAPHDHLFDGTTHTEIRQTRVRATTGHGAGCTHSATLAAELAKGASLLDAATTAAAVTAAAIAAGLEGIGTGPGPVDVLHARAT